MALLWRGLVLGLAFGLAAACVEIWLSLLPFMERRMGPGPTFMLQVALLQVALGALLGRHDPHAAASTWNQSGKPAGGRPPSSPRSRARARTDPY